MAVKALILAGGMAAMTGTVPAAAGVIGVVAPRNGPYAVLGTQIFAGARSAIEAAGHTVAEIHESCEEESGSAVAQKLREAKASIAIGFLCVETLQTALPKLKDGNIPAISLAVRSKILMEDALEKRWPFFRLAPSEEAEGEKLADIILDRWKAHPIAIIEDGTIYGRELAREIRERLQAFGIKPVFSDTYRPGQEQQVALVRRLAKAGSTHVFIGGDRADISIIARDAASEKQELTLLGGDALRAVNRPLPLGQGVLAVALPDYATLPSAANAVRLLQEKKTEPDGYTLPAFAAAELASQAINSQSPVEALSNTVFPTAIGEIGFGPGHELSENPYRLLEWRGSAFAVAP